MFQIGRVTKNNIDGITFEVFLMKIKAAFYKKEN
jgi:hypothetical protein